MTEQTEELKEETEQIEEPRKQSEELKAIIMAIEKYCLKHDNKITFHAAFCAFDKDNEVIDEGMFAFGPKDVILLSMEDMLEQVKEDKKEFISW